MSTSNLIVTTLDHNTGKAQQKSILSLNPNAADEHLRTFAQMTVALTKDTYVKTDRVDKRNLDTDPKPYFNISRALTPKADGSSYDVITPVGATINLTRSISQLSSDSKGKYIYVNFYYRVPVIAEPKDLTTTSSDVWTLNPPSYTYNNGDPFCASRAYCTDITQAQTVSYVVHFEPIGDYRGRDITVTITITADE